MPSLSSCEAGYYKMALKSRKAACKHLFDAIDDKNIISRAFFAAELALALNNKSQKY